MSEAQAIAPEETETPKSESGLLLDSLEIENFRCFRYLTIPKLGRVNLITGKNNVGKSTLLEAVWLYLYRFNPNYLRQILLYREELIESMNVSRIDYYQKSLFDDFDIYSDELAVLNSLFFSRKDVFDSGDSIRIKGFGIKQSEIKVSFESFLSDMNTVVPDFQFQNSEKRFPIDSPYMIVDISNRGKLGYLVERIVDRRRRITSRIAPHGNNQFIKVNGISSVEIGKLWDRISLTQEKSFIVDSLKIIYPDIKGLAFIGDGENSYRRIPYAMTDDFEKAVPLRSLGDGINRALIINLAIGNSNSGICLIDEIDSGLHYSVLVEFWRSVFLYSKVMDCQIFATTHSWECIEAFQKVSAEDNDPNSGMLIRLQNRDGDIVATNFDEDGLEVMTRRGLEVR